MRYALIILSIFLFNNSANASYKVETLLGYCKIAEKYDYGQDYEKMNEEEFSKAYMCRSYIGALASKGSMNCAFFNLILKSPDNKNYYTYLKSIKHFVTNGDLSQNQAIASFLNYAKSNPKVWNTDVVMLTENFLSKDFPCRLKMQ